MASENIAHRTFKFRLAKACYNSDGLKKLLEQPFQAYPQFNLFRRSNMAAILIPNNTRTSKLKGLEREVVEAYQSGLSTRKVANVFVVSESTIRSLLKRLHVPTRSISEGIMLTCTPERNEAIGVQMRGKPSRVKGKRWKLNHIKRNPAIAGERNPNWKGGITPANQKIRMSPEYKAWRLAVYRRDNWTCVFCGVKSTGAKVARGEVAIHADHIKPFAEYPELRFDVANGRTLCAVCHRQTETWGGRTKFQKKVA